jgi:hypothetical protein
MKNYYHDDQLVEGYRDFRNDLSQPPDPYNIYYVVFRIQTGNAIWYHHTAMTIDGDLYSHVLSAKCVLLAQLNRGEAIVTCVLIRSLIHLNESIITDKNRQHLVKQRNAILNTATKLSDEPIRFSVIGFIGRDKAVLFEILGDDALAVNIEASQSCQDKYEENFYPIEIMAVSPVMFSIAKMFQTRKPILLAHANSSFSKDRQITG